MYFSFRGERKVPKESPLKESTHGTFLKDPFPLSARHFAYGEMANALLSRSLPWSRTVVRMTTARLVTRLVRPTVSPSPTSKTATWRIQQMGEFRADGAPPFVRVIGSWRPYARSTSFAPLWAKEVRAVG